jgi:DNA-binding Lrp family transcriptional regulator
MSPGLTELWTPGAAAPTGDGEPPSPPCRLAAAAAVAVSSGNRCGHVPSAPRFHLLNLPEDANPARPVLIGQATAKLQEYYATPREARWDPLSQSERHRRLERQIEAAGGPDTESGRPLATRLARWRQQRSERREAVTVVLMLLLTYTDIATLTVGIPQGGGWLGLSIAWIAERTGLSPSRVKRALATLTRAGLLSTTGAGRRFDRRSRRWIGAGWGPVRRLSFDLIRRIGLDVSWDRARRRQRKDRRPAPPPPAPLPPVGSPAAQREHLQALRQRLKPRVGNDSTAAPPAVEQLHAARERTRWIAELAAAGLSPAEIRQRLNDAPQPP